MSFFCFVQFFGNLGITLFCTSDLCDTCDLKQIRLTWVEVRDRYVFLFGLGVYFHRCVCVYVLSLFVYTCIYVFDAPTCMLRHSGTLMGGAWLKRAREVHVNRCF